MSHSIREGGAPRRDSGSPCGAAPHSSPPAAVSMRCDARISKTASERFTSLVEIYMTELDELSVHTYVIEVQENVKNFKRIFNRLQKQLQKSGKQIFKF